MCNANFSDSTSLPYSQMVTAPDCRLIVNFSSLTMQSGQAAQVTIM
jgi:hypothetical protein